MTMTPMQRVEILRASCCIAGADGETTSDEMAHLRSLADSVGVGDASLTAMIERAERDPEFFQQQFRVLKEEPLTCLEVLIQTTLANGSVKESEFEILKGLATMLNIGDEDFRQKVSAAVDQ